SKRCGEWYAGPGNCSTDCRGKHARRLTRFGSGLVPSHCEAPGHGEAPCLLNQSPLSPANALTASHRRLHCRDTLPRRTMARTCTSCGYNPIGPFTDNCPLCGESVRLGAVVSQTSAFICAICV